MKRLWIITGSAGFVGCHFVEHLLNKTNDFILGIESFRHAGYSSRVHHLIGDRYKIVTHDLSTPIDPHLEYKMMNMFSGFKEIYLLNLASLSHVDDSIENPAPFIENNCKIAINIGEFCRKNKRIKKIMHLSTDEVFGPAFPNESHKEWDSILPSNPYSASKASQESILFSYWRTFGIPLYIVRSMNMLGSFQGKEKFVPTVIRKVFKEETVQIHGTPTRVGSRMYIHSKNLADAFLFLALNTEPVFYKDNDNKNDPCNKPMCFNVVGSEEVDNLTLAKKIALIMNKELKYEFLDFHAARAGHDRRYSLDATKIYSLGWRPFLTLDESLNEIVDWYLKHKEWLL